MAKAKGRRIHRDGVLPTGTNPLAVRIGKLCRLYRIARGFDYQRAAESLAIDTGTYIWVERGLLVPYPALAQRIGQWLVEKIDFDGRPLQKGDGGTRTEFGRDGTEKAYKVYLAEKDRRLLRLRAKKLGMSARDLLTVYVRRGLLSETTFATLQQAKE